MDASYVTFDPQCHSQQEGFVMVGKGKKSTGKNSKTISTIIFDVERGKVLKESLERVYSDDKELTRKYFCLFLGVGEEQMRKYERGKDTISQEKLMLLQALFIRHGYDSLADEFIGRMREIEDVLGKIYTNEDFTETLKDSEGRGFHIGDFLRNLREHLGGLSHEGFSDRLEKNRAEQEQKNRKSSQRITPEQLRALAEFKNEDELTKEDRELLIKIIRFSGVPLKEWRYVFAGDVVSV